jgi:hypothetical protein
MMELVDMPGLGSGDHNVHGGSSPSIRTSLNRLNRFFYRGKS